MRNPPIIACLFITAHTQVNIFIKPYFWGIYPSYKEIVIPTSRMCFFQVFCRWQLGKERSFALEVTRQ